MLRSIRNINLLYRKSIDLLSEPIFFAFRQNEKYKIISIVMKKNVIIQAV
jgi:hypothetical protein